MNSLALDRSPVNMWVYYPLICRFFLLVQWGLVEWALVDLHLVDLLLVDLLPVDLRMDLLVVHEDAHHRYTFLLLVVLLLVVATTQMGCMSSYLYHPHWVDRVGLVLWLWIELRRLRPHDPSLG
jgi:hypothetical protein